MFGKKKNSINKVVVSSKEELKTAIKRKEPYIEVQGDLAKKMKWMGKLSSVKIAAIIALLLRKVPGGSPCFFSNVPTVQSLLVFLVFLSAIY